jgi:hypothetical protein
VLVGGKSNILTKFWEFVRQICLEASADERQSYGYLVAECRPT